jgi:transposase
MPNRVRRIDLSVGERRSLRGLMTATRSKREYRKASAILEKADGLTYEAIAERHGVHKETAKRWVKAYTKHGLDGLRDKPHPGRPSRYTEAQRRRIVELALQSPRLFGYLKNGWSVRLLSRHLTREVGVKISKSQVWRILHEAGIVHKRPKATVKSPDPDYERKAAKVSAYKRIAPALEKRGY